MNITNVKTICITIMVCLLMICITIIWLNHHPYPFIIEMDNNTLEATTSTIRFEHPKEIKLYNEQGLLTTEEVLSKETTYSFPIRLTSQDGFELAKLCIEHKFDLINLGRLYHTSVPLDFVSRKNYHVECWDLESIEPYERADLAMEVYIRDVIEEHTVVMSIWVNETKTI